MHLRSERYGIFSDNPHNLSLDKRCLLKMGAKDVDVFSSWAEAEEAFETAEIDFALVDERVRDASCFECIERLRRYSSKPMPVVVVTNDRRRDTVLDSIAVGCGGYVLRPYSMETLSRHLRAASSSSQPDEIEREMLMEGLDLVTAGQFDEALETLEELVEDENPALEYFNKGMKFLSEEKYGKAIAAFNKAIAINEMYAEAYKGMADAYKGKGNDEKYQSCLSKAGDIYAIQGKLDQAKQIFIEILQNEPDAVNPFNRLGMNLRKEGDYEGAIRAYHQACELTPDDANLYYNMARAYVFSGDCASALDCINRSISLDPDMEHAHVLRNQIQRKCEIPAREKETGHKDMSGRVLIDLDM